VTTEPHRVVDVEAVAGDLYQLDPASFVAERDTRVAAARGEGDRPAADAIKAFKRPSPPAWAVNLLARADPDDLDALVDLGARLRAAQAALSGDELRRLSRERHKFVSGLARQARNLAAERGRPLSPTAGRQVEETLNAALADAEAAAAVASGRLVRALEHTGMGPVDLDGAVAGPSGDRKPARSPGPKAGSGPSDSDMAQLDAQLTPLKTQPTPLKAELDRRRAEAAAAEQEVAAAEAVAQEAGGAFDAADQRRVAAESDVHRLEADLQSARAEAKAARAAAGTAARSRQEAERALDAARHRSALAQERVAGLEGSGPGSGHRDG